MPDGFSFHLRYGDTGETFSSTSSTGDADSFRDACEAVKESAAGRDETEIRQILVSELRSRDINLTMPGMVDVLATAIPPAMPSLRSAVRKSRPFWLRSLPAWHSLS
jgi:hypothetical protein